MRPRNRASRTAFDRFHRWGPHENNTNQSCGKESVASTRTRWRQNHHIDAPHRPMDDPSHSNACRQASSWSSTLLRRKSPHQAWNEWYFRRGRRNPRADSLRTPRSVPENRSKPYRVPIRQDLSTTSRIRPHPEMGPYTESQARVVDPHGVNVGHSSMNIDRSCGCCTSSRRFPIVIPV